MPEKKHIHFEFSADLVKKPLVYNLTRQFDVVVTIRGASVTESGGFIALELEGESEEIGKLLAFLESQGIEVAEGLGGSASDGGQP